MKKIIRSLKESKVSQLDLLIYSCIIAALILIGHGAQIIAANKRQEKVLAHKCNTADSVPDVKNY